MYRTQELKVMTDLLLSDLTLDKDREIEIFCKTDSEIEPNKYIKLVNVNGKLVIFAENLEDVVIEEWKGHFPASKLIRQIEDEE